MPGEHFLKNVSFVFNQNVNLVSAKKTTNRLQQIDDDGFKSKKLFTEVIRIIKKWFTYMWMWKWTVMQ